MNKNNEIKIINESPSGEVRRLVILGAGESGIGAALLAQQKGFDVFVSDAGKIKSADKALLQSHAIAFEEGVHTPGRILNADEVVKSPGIPEDNDMIKQVRAKGIPVISEIELAYRFKGDSRIVGITGSNGKSTCTSLIYHICQTAGINCAMVGNIGYSFARQVATDPKEWYIVEISSFQLDDIKEFNSDIAILLNITADHLDRYDYSIKKYIESKFRIIQNQKPGNHFIYNDDDEVILDYLKTISINTNQLPFSMKHEVKKGAFVIGDQMIVKVKEEEEPLRMSVFDFASTGKHNQYNTMAAGISGSVIGIRNQKIRESVGTFRTLEHRSEYVATVRGVTFINDSKATNVNSTWYGLENIDKPTILILGGIDKGNDYSILIDLVKEKVKAIVCMGLDNSKIHEAFEGVVPVIVDTASASEAVHQAFHLAAKGDVVLLSPACSSFDLFTNFADRGKQFKEAVKNL